MKMNKSMILILLLIALLALTVASQISQVTSTISIEEGKSCNTIFYNENQDVYGYVTRERSAYGNCLYYHNYTHCINTTGPNTGCSNEQQIRNLSCISGRESYQSYEVIGTQIATRNTTKCNTKSFIVSIAKGTSTERKEIDFSNWGVCVNNNENNCLVITCVSNEDGAFRGQFTDCKGGKSCQRFEICDNSIKIFYKNSRNNFVEYDPTFHLSPLAIKDVGK